MLEQLAAFDFWSLISLNFYLDLLGDFLGLSWYFFTSWEFIVAFIIFTTLRYMRKPTEVIEEVISGDGPEKHYRHKQCPPWFANGWMPVFQSRDLAKGGLKAVTVVGNDLIVWRGVSGTAHVFDAYCPHLGANIGVGGSVVGDEVKCPFHGWQFNTDGRCASVPGLPEKETPKARMKKVWEVEETNGYVFIWHHLVHDKSTYKIEPIEALKQEHPFRFRMVVNVESHIQEITECGPDERHFNVKPRNPKWWSWLLKKTKTYNEKKKVFAIDWKSHWTFHEPSAHQSNAKIDSVVRIYGLPIVEAKFDVVNTGPAYGVTKIDVKFLKIWHFTIYKVEAIVQLNRVEQQLCKQIYSESTTAALVYKMCIYPHTLRDKLIWDNKKFLARPYITDDEIIVKHFRRWYNQFYDQNSKYIQEYMDPHMLTDDGKVVLDDGRIVDWDDPAHKRRSDSDDED